MVRDLLRDPAVGRVDVVDWSDELPRRLDRRWARLLLDDALLHLAPASRGPVG